MMQHSIGTLSHISPAMVHHKKIKNMLILIGPIIVGNRVHNFHTNWVIATRWCCIRGQEISTE